MNTSTKLIASTAVVSLLILDGTREIQAASVAQWELSESNSALTNNANGTWNGVVESTGTFTGSQIWSPDGSNTLPEGFVGNSPGTDPADFYYDFGAHPGGGFGVNTGSTNLLPSTADFSILATIRRDAVPTGGEYLLSNNRNQQGRMDFGFIAGDLFFFINGGLNAQPNIALFADVSEMAFNGEWQSVGVSRDGDSGEVRLMVNGSTVATGTSFAEISTAELYTIGRRRGGLNENYLGEISDIQVHNAVIPEPGTVALLTGFAALLVAVRLCRRK